MSAPAPLAIIGPTASGKTALAIALAKAEPCEVVSMDSMQVYRRMDIGTAKATAQEQAAVAHHMLDLVEPSESFDLSRFQTGALAAIVGIESRGARPLLVGGTGLYVQAVVDELELPGQFPEVRAELDADPDTESQYRRLEALDPLAASRMEPNNRRRMLRALEVTVGSGRPFSSFGPGMETYPPNRFTQIGMSVEREELNQRIVERYQRQLDNGLLEEIRALVDSPGGMSVTAAQALGYKEFVDHLAGRQSLEDALTLAINRTRRFARRQMRWFRRDPRITWFDASNPDQLLSLVQEHLAASSSSDD